MSERPIVVTETYGQPPERVWAAITDANEMRRWFFHEIETFEPTVGFESKFTVSNELGDYLHLWTIIEASPNERIVYDWRYEGREGAAKVTWLLTATDGGTQLELTHAGHETFPQDDPAFTRESCEGGWRYFLSERLKAYLQ